MIDILLMTKIKMYFHTNEWCQNTIFFFQHNNHSSNQTLQNIPLELQEQVAFCCRKKNTDATSPPEKSSYSVINCNTYGNCTKRMRVSSNACCFRNVNKSFYYLFKKKYAFRTYL